MEKIPDELDNVISKIERKEYTHTEMRDILIFCQRIENRINQIRKRIEYYKNGEDLK